MEGGDYRQNSLTHTDIDIEIKDVCQERHYIPFFSFQLTILLAKIYFTLQKRLTAQHSKSVPKRNCCVEKVFPSFYSFSSFLKGKETVIIFIYVNS